MTLKFMQKVKEMGFLVKLDSNGTRPNFLKEALEKKLVDYFHEERNAHLHLKFEQRVPAIILPLLNRIIKQGVDEGLFNTKGSSFSYFVTPVICKASLVE